MTTTLPAPPISRPKLEAAALEAEGPRHKAEGAIYPAAPRIGLVVGTYAAVPYVHLQLEARRRFYPGVPMLVHDDGSPRAHVLEPLCRYYGAEFVRNAERAPACIGDLGAFATGLRWARARGVDVLVKLSRRFVPRVDWTGPLAALAVDSQYATFCAWTRSFDYGFRSECVGMGVEEWTRLGLLEEIERRMAEPGEPFVEMFLHGLARRAAARNCPAARAYDERTGQRPPDRDGYAVWDFMGTDRCKPSPNYLWHDWAPPTAYEALARNWGLAHKHEDWRDPNVGRGVRRGDAERGRRGDLEKRGRMR